MSKAEGQSNPNLALIPVVLRYFRVLEVQRRRTIKVRKDSAVQGINGPTGILIGAGLTVCGWNDVLIPAVETNQTIPAQIPTNFPEGIHEKYALDLAHAQTLVTFALDDLCTWPVN